MSDAALTLVNLGLLGALYLFFGWVLWSGFNQLRRSPASASAPVAAAQPKASSSPRKARGQVMITAPPELAGSVMSIGDDFSIGRAPQCSLTLDDTYVSQHHASIVWKDRQYVAGDAGSTNGTYVNEERLTQAVVLRPGDQVRIGSTVLEFS